MFRWGHGTVADSAHGLHKIKSFCFLFVHKNEPSFACVQSFGCGFQKHSMTASITNCMVMTMVTQPGQP